jgi:hypothetical protein
MSAGAVFVGFSFFRDRGMIQVCRGSWRAQGENPMHDLLIALAFIGMVIAPAVVAANSNVADENE